MSIGKLMLDDRGFLQNPSDWNSEIAHRLAIHLPCELDARHFEIIDLLRQVFFDHHLQPANRALVKLVKMQLGDDKGNSIYLMTLFGGSFAREAARVSGLPIPPGCL